MPVPMETQQIIIILIKITLLMEITTIITAGRE